MSSAGKLSQAHSIGLVDKTNVKVSQETKELEGMFPKQLIASAIIKQLATISATFREMSRKNLSVLLGAGIVAAATSVSTTIAADLALNAAGATLASGTGFAAGDICVIYQNGKPESVSVVKLLTLSSNAVTWTAGRLSTALTAADGVINFYKANEVPLGNVTKVNYFAASAVWQSASGKPNFFNFWKVAVGGSMDFNTNGDDFASSDMELKVLQPAASDLAGDLSAVAPIIATNPMGLLVLNG
jgi:hypothetical protein